MLIQYTPISSLSAVEMQQLRSMVTHMRLEAVGDINLNGKIIRREEVAQQKLIWNQLTQRQQLNG